MQIESGDCWYAEPEFAMEGNVTSGQLEGSMYGLRRGHKAGPHAPAAAAPAARRGDMHQRRMGGGRARPVVT